MTKTSVDIYSARLKNVRRSIKKKERDGFLVTNMCNVRYLSGFSGSSGFLFITGKDNIFVTDFRYKEQSEKEVKGWDLIIEMGNRIKTIRALTKKNGIRKLGFESSASYDFFGSMCDLDLTLNASKGLIEKLREIKDRTEIDSIKKAVERAEAAFLDVKPYIKEGTREISIALRLEESLREKGCGHIPFEIIVASGAHSAMPHARPTQKKLNKGDFVIIDWGGEADGYYSDMTRTLLIKGGRGIGEKKKIYQTVLEANQRAISYVAAGVPSRKIDEAARAFIRGAGFGECFGHGTGHGVGMQVHEAPRISWNKSERIKKNMVFTIEPGIYLPNVGGVRIEDMVLVKPEGPEVLTSLAKKLQVI
jgi:Xaa-Pro aminopeptidase